MNADQAVMNVAHDAETGVANKSKSMLTGRDGRLAKVYRRDLPNSYRRRIVESLCKFSKGRAVGPHDFNPKEMEARYLMLELEQKRYLEEKKKLIDKSCFCNTYDYFYDDCRRCEDLFAFEHYFPELDEENPSFVPELVSTKSAMRDGTTWRRKPTRSEANERTTKHQKGQQKRKHRDQLFALEICV
jgi:hypothetical protein